MRWFNKQQERDRHEPKRLPVVANTSRPQSPPSAVAPPVASDHDRALSVASTDGQSTVEEQESNDTRDEEGFVDVNRTATTTGVKSTGQIMSFEYDGEDTKTGYSKDYTDQPSTQMTHQDVVPQQNHLNSLFNGHLMKWKFEAEEGSSFIRVPAFFGAIGLLSTAVVALVLYPDAWTTHSIVMSVCVITLSIFVAVLDGRFLATNPLSARAHLRNVLTRNFNIFRYVWGRAILYIVAGVLNVAQLWLITICSGSFMICLGLVALAVGIHASRKFAALRSSLADESFLLLAFSNFDGDGDGYLAPHEFANLLADLGMELDDRYTLKAFNVIDSDNDRRISFDEFNHWWASGYIERGRKRPNSDVYRRMD